MLPSQVKGRDGRVVPFDADAIGERLFAAAQTLGAADAFLVRELTDGVLHFLTQEDLGEIASADAIDDVVEKVVRELGQPALAARFAKSGTSARAYPPLTIPYEPAQSPDEVVRRCLDEFSLRTVFSADVAAAHDEGLIRLDLTSPRKLDAVVLDSAQLHGDAFDAGWDLVNAGAANAGRHLVLDGPDWLLSDPGDVGNFVNGLSRAALARRIEVDVHVNSAAPPAWAEPRSAGPLFDAPTPAASSARLWLTPLRHASTNLRLVWHWRDDPAADQPFLEWLQAPYSDCAVVFDRPRQPISLSRSLSRRRPGVVLSVGLNLPKLLNRPDVGCQGEVFLEKLPSLSRFAVSAGVQKRNDLRQYQPHLTGGFLLDRSAVRIEPLGFSTALEQLMGVRLPTTKPARALATQILSALRSPLEEARRRTGIEFVVDSPEMQLESESPIDAALALDDVGRGAIDTDCLHLTVAQSQPDWTTVFSTISRKSAVCAIQLSGGL